MRGAAHTICTVNGDQGCGSHNVATSWDWGGVGGGDGWILIVIDRTTNIFGKTEPKTELIFGRTEYSKKNRIFSFLFCWNFTE